jgi:hypothetical protein
LFGTLKEFFLSLHRSKMCAAEDVAETSGNFFCPKGKRNTGSNRVS